MRGTFTHHTLKVDIPDLTNPNLLYAPSYFMGWVGGGEGGSEIFVFSGPRTPPIFFLGSENIWVTLGAGLGTSWKHVFCSFWQPSQSSWDPSK